MTNPIQAALPVAPAARRPAGTRLPERLALAGLAFAGVVALAAWQIPPLLDWSRYKQAIAHYASARLGRHVTIAGQVRLLLLPRAMLMADGVTLADRGDGISARLGTMRLEVSLASLLAGRVVPRDLALEQPEATLPWPLPRAAAPGMRPTVANEFSANIGNGSLRIGGALFHDISASIHTDPDSGAFGAQGSAVIAGLPWHFSARIGAPGADGISPLTLTLDGQAAHRRERQGQPSLEGTGGVFRGRILPDGSVTGTLTMRGPDLSRLGAGPASPWQVQGPVQGDAATLSAPDLAFTLAGAPGHANATLRLGPSAALALGVHAGQIALGPWLLPLIRAAPALPMRLTLDATAATLQGGTMINPRAVLANGPGGLTLDSASATLPGGAALDLSGAMPPGGAFSGRMHLAAPTLRRTLAWLAPGTATLPAGVLTRADVRAAFAVAAPHAAITGAVGTDTAGTGTALTGIALTGIAGTVDASTVTGSLTVTPNAPSTPNLSLGADPAAPAAAPPTVRAALTVDRIDLTPWSAAGLAGFAGTDAAVALQAGTATIGPLSTRAALLDLQTGPAGFSLHRLAADLPGAHLEASGVLGWDGTVADGRLDLAAPDAAALPAAWRQPPGLWQGPFHLALTGAGPAANLAAQLRADLGDLRAEAEARVDMTAFRVTATVTVRHPGAPRLLDALGLPGAGQWLENGSVALLAHLTARPGHVPPHARISHCPPPCCTPPAAWMRILPARARC